MRLRTLVFLALSLAAAAAGLWQWRAAQLSAARRLETAQDQSRIDATAASLDRPLQFTGQTVWLSEFAALVGKISGLAVDADERAFEIQFSRPRYVTIDIPQGRFSLRAALNLALEPKKLCYDIYDSRLVITTPDASRDRNQLRTVVYPLPQPEFSSGAVDAAAWSNLVTTIVQPDDWIDVGGRGHCEPVPGALVIAQCEHVHRQIRRLLDSLGRLRSPPQSLAPIPIAPFLEPASERRLLATLAEPTSIDCRDLPMDELMAELSLRHQIPIVLDTEPLNGAAVRIETPITANCPGVSLRSALRQVLDRLDLTFRIGNEALVVTTHEQAESPDFMRVVAYPVHDLVARPGGGGDFDSLIDMLTTTIAPESWVDVGGPGSIEPLDGWLLISQTLDIHGQIEDLLAQLRRALSYDEHPRVLGIAAERPSEQRIRTALDQPIVLHFTETPLVEAMDCLARQVHIPIILNLKKLEEAGVNVDTPINCDLAAAPLGSQLRWLLDQLSLTYLIRDEVLSITTPEDAESPGHMLTRLYDVRPLLDPDLGIADPDSLIDVIPTLIAPESWTDTGGPGSVIDFRGLLVFSQAEEVHEQVERLLTVLEENCLRKAKPPVNGPLLVRVGWTAAQEKIRQLLETPVDVEIDDQPLETALQQLAAQHQLPLVIDKRRWQNGEIDAAARVTLKIKGIALASALRHVLEQNGLDWQFRDASLVMTTREAQPADLPLVAYWVDDLVSLRGGRNSDALIDLMTTTVNPESWRDVGGPGGVNELGQWLLVAQTDEVQEQIERLLAQLRRGLAAEKRFATLDASVQRPGDQRLRAALDRELPLHFEKTPLPEALASLSRELDVPILIAGKPLAEAKIDPAWLISSDLAAAPLRNQLRLLLEPLALTATCRDEVLLITTPADAELPRHLPIRLYDVRRLIGPEEGFTSAAGLSDMVQALVARDSWDDVGGSGELRTFHGLLVVSHTDDIHRRVERLLAALDEHCLRPKVVPSLREGQARSSPPPSAALSPEQPTIVIDANPVEARIEKLLDTPVDVDFRGITLKEALTQLAAEHQLPLVVSDEVLEAGGTWQLPVRRTARGERLATELDRLLLGEGLSYIVRDRVLLVTDEVRAAELSSVRLYRVDDLLAARRIDIETLADQVTSTTGLGEWVGEGGAAEAVKISSGWLAVAGSTHLHQRVADRLAELRTGRTPPRERERRELADGLLNKEKAP